MSFLKLLFLMSIQVLPSLAWSASNRYIFDESLQDQFDCKIEVSPDQLVITAKNLPLNHLGKDSLNAGYLQSFQISFDGPFVFKESEVDSLTFSITFPYSINKSIDKSNLVLDSGISSSEAPKVIFYTSLIIFDDGPSFREQDYEVSPINVSYDHGEFNFLFPMSPETNFLFKGSTPNAYLMSLFKPYPMVCLAKVNK